MKLVILFCVVALAACRAPVRIESEPSGARVEIEGHFIGYTPLELDLAADSSDIRIELAGYDTIETRMSRRFDARSLVWIPVLPVLAYPGVSLRIDAVQRFALQRSLQGAETPALLPVEP